MITPLGKPLMDGVSSLHTQPKAEKAGLCLSSGFYESLTPSSSPYELQLICKSLSLVGCFPLEACQQRQGLMLDDGEGAKQTQAFPGQGAPSAPATPAAPVFPPLAAPAQARPANGFFCTLLLFLFLKKSIKLKNVCRSRKWLFISIIHKA